MSDVYVTTGSAESSKRLLNRASDSAPITDAAVADDANIAYRKLRAYVGEIHMDPTAAVPYPIIVRHGLGVMPLFVTMTPTVGASWVAARVVSMTDRAVYLEYTGSGGVLPETAMIKVEG